LPLSGLREGTLFIWCMSDEKRTAAIKGVAKIGKWARSVVFLAHAGPDTKRMGATL
jgi:hypothetical protein